MKMICTLIAMLTCVSYGYSQDFMSEIDAQAGKIIDSTDSDADADEDELLYAFYSAEIARCDGDMLANNPELVFRRAVAWSNTVEIDEDAIGSSLDTFSQISKEFAFVLENADADSRLYQATALQKGLLDNIVAAAPTTIDQFFSVVLQYLDNLLSPWAAGSNATGAELRQAVLSNIQQNPDLMNSFCDFILLTQDDARLSLGYITPDQVIVGELSTDEDGHVGIQYKIVYRTPTSMNSIEGEL